MKKDIIELFQDMHQSGSFVKSINSSFMVLIAKYGRPHNIKDFRRISLVGCIYKLIAKVLARRITSVMDNVIGECQHAFVRGRSLALL